jgi:hypothetical protein
MKKAGTKSSSARKRRQQIIVLKDGDGNYYELARATLERSRVDKDRKREVEAALEDEDCFTSWIKRATIPGSIAAAPFEGGRALHYAGFYLSGASKKD